MITRQNDDEAIEQFAPYKGAAQRQLHQNDDTKDPEGTPTSQPDPSESTEATQVQSRVDPEEETFKKRYGDLRRHMQKVQDDFKKEVADLKRQLRETTSQKIQLPKSKEEIAAWSQQFPDIAAIVESIAAMKADERAQGVEEELTQLRQERARTTREKAEAKLLELHPDFIELRDSQELHIWAETQPEMIQAWLYDNPDNALLCARALDLYKADKGIGKFAKKDEARQERDASRSTGKTRRVEEPTGNDKGNLWKESDVARLSPQDFEAYEADITKAIREGRFVYDVSRPE